MSKAAPRRRLRRRLAARRVLLLLPVDVAATVLALYGSLLLRFDGRIEAPYDAFLPFLFVPIVAVRVALLAALGLYDVQWKFAGLRELTRLAFASAVATTLFTAGFVFLQWGGQPQVLPRSVLVIDFLLFTALAGGARLVPRFLARVPLTARGRQAALVYGAGAAGEQLVRDMGRHPEYPYFPAGFIDDDPRKWGTTIHGVRVLGDGNQLAAAASRTQAEALIVAIPSLAAPHVRRIVERARAAGLAEIRTLPGLDQILSGDVTVNQVREVNLEDLMGREPVSLDTGAIEGYLRGKRVLVTGAAGSIGSELVRQMRRFAPGRVCLLDHDETEMYALLQKLRQEGGLEVEAQIADVRDTDRIDAVFSAFSPEVVFHAAAYKHVPMIEPHPVEAAKTNVFGTRNVAHAAARHGCGKFILISTDKAVNPSSVMGVTKRIAEIVIREAGRSSPCRFAAVRFGNVLGSRGSVVPIFREQIARGGPVTVTHPEMKRYFMTVHEACLLVLQAAALAAGGEVLVLDMGEPVRIVDLAREMIRFSGFQPETEVAIAFTGVRPGEKLFEEYLTSEEGVDATRHQKIFTARITHDLAGDLFEARVGELEDACGAGDDARARRIFKGIVPTFGEPARPQPVEEAR